MGDSISTATLWSCFETLLFSQKTFDNRNIVKHHMQRYQTKMASQSMLMSSWQQAGEQLYLSVFLPKVFTSFLDERFKNLNMTKFYADTVPDIYLPFCEYHRESCNRNNEWKFKFTFYGYCLEFNNDTTEEPLKVRQILTIPGNIRQTHSKS